MKSITWALVALIGSTDRKREERKHGTDIDERAAVTLHESGQHCKVGTLILARAVNDEAFAREILTEARKRIN